MMTNGSDDDVWSQFSQEPAFETLASAVLCISLLIAQRAGIF